MLAASALDSAPNSEMTPAITQHIRSRPADCTSDAIGAVFLKMPEPIMLPMTIMTAVKSPRRRRRPLACMG